jgi:hypothetical protein
MTMSQRFSHVRQVLTGFLAQIRVWENNNRTSQPVLRDVVENFERYLQKRQIWFHFGDNLTLVQQACQDCLANEEYASIHSLLLASLQLLAYCNPRNLVDDNNRYLSPLGGQRITCHDVYFSSAGYWIPARELQPVSIAVLEYLSAGQLSTAEIRAVAGYTIWHQQQQRSVLFETLHNKSHFLVLLLAVIIQLRLDAEPNRMDVFLNISANVLALVQIATCWWLYTYFLAHCTQWFKQAQHAAVVDAASVDDDTTPCLQRIVFVPGTVMTLSVIPEYNEIVQQIRDLIAQSVVQQAFNRS